MRNIEESSVGRFQFGSMFPLLELLCTGCSTGRILLLLSGVMFGNSLSKRNISPFERPQRGKELIWVRIAFPILLLFCLPTVTANAQQTVMPRAAKITELNASDRISLQQIDGLIEQEDWPSAVDEVIRLIDEAGDRLIKIEPANTARGANAVRDDKAGFERWVPLGDYLRDRMIQWGAAGLGVLAEYRSRVDRIAKAEFDSAFQQRDLWGAERAARRHLASSVGDDALKLFANLALDCGWPEVARDAIEKIDRRFLVLAESEASSQQVAGVSWHSAAASFPKLKVDTIADRIANQDGHVFGVCRDSDLPLEKTALRLVYCSLVAGQTKRAAGELALAQRVFGESLDSEKLALLQSMLSARAVSQRRKPLRISKFPKWQRRLLNASAQADESSLDANRFGREPAVVPIAVGNHVFAHSINAIRGFHLKTGRPWPIDDESAALFESGLTIKESLAPANLPVSADPLFRLNHAGDLLSARLGPPVTGWLPVIRRASGSINQIAALDLAEEGRLLNAYPRGAPESLENYEFESPPLIVGDRVLVGVTRRDNALYESRVVCSDLVTGQPLWSSSNLATSNMLQAADANRVSHSQIVIRGNQLFYHASLGTVASLQLDSGKVSWLVRYPRGELAGDPYGQKRLAEQRAESQMMLAGDYAFVLAADCDRVFALDAGTGALAWASRAGQGGGMRHLIGTSREHLIGAGDRLYWLNKHTGDFEAAFGATNQQSPGGLGLGIAARFAGYVFWPTAKSIFVFDEDLSAFEGTRSPRLENRIDLRVLGQCGGNVVIAGGMLVVAGPNQLMAFEIR